MENAELLAEIKRYEYELSEGREDYSKTSYGGKVTMIIFGSVIGIIPAIIIIVAIIGMISSINVEDSETLINGGITMLVISMPFFILGLLLFIFGIVGLRKRQSKRVEAINRIENAKRHLESLYSKEGNTKEKIEVEVVD